MPSSADAQAGGRALLLPCPGTQPRSRELPLRRLSPAGAGSRAPAAASLCPPGNWHAAASGPVWRRRRVPPMLARKLPHSGAVLCTGADGKTFMKVPSSCPGRPGGEAP